MSFKVKKIIETDDGVTHESVDAAKKHVFKRHVIALSEAGIAEFENAISGTKEGDNPETTAKVRDALREVYLAAFPRANTGKPRGPRKPKVVESATDDGDDGRAGDGRGEDESSPAKTEESATKPARNSKKKAA